MEQEQHSDKLHKVAESAYLQIASKMSGIIIMGLTAWILSSVNSMQSNIATLVEGVKSNSVRISTLEEWRNMSEAYGNPIENGNNRHGH